MDFRDHYNLQRHYNRKKKCVPIGTVIEKPKWYCECCDRSFSCKSHYTAHLKTLIHARISSERASRVECEPEENLNQSDSSQTVGQSNLTDEIANDGEVDHVRPSVQSSQLDRGASSDFSYISEVQTSMMRRHMPFSRPSL